MLQQWGRRCGYKRLVEETLPWIRKPVSVDCKNYMNFVKEEQTVTCSELLNIFHKMLDNLKRYNWLNQAKNAGFKTNGVNKLLLEVPQWRWKEGQPASHGTYHHTVASVWSFEKYLLTGGSLTGKGLRVGLNINKCTENNYFLRFSPSVCHSYYHHTHTHADLLLEVHFSPPMLSVDFVYTVPMPSVTPGWQPAPLIMWQLFTQTHSAFSTTASSVAGDRGIGCLTFPNWQTISLTALESLTLYKRSSKMPVWGVLCSRCMFL